MSAPLRVLLVEDTPSDAKLVERSLRAAGFAPEIERVEDQEALQAALDRQGWDIVISDWSLPTFGAVAALEVVRGRGLEVPFLIVSGTIGEETAVAALRAGAQDFLLKDKLARLGPAVERELREGRVRAELRRRQEEVERFFNLSLDLLCISGFDGYLKRVNGAWQATLGWMAEELLAEPWMERIHPDDRGATAGVFDRLRAGTSKPLSFENRWRAKDGATRHLLWTAVAFPDEQRVYAAARDITDRKRAEQELLQAQKMEAIGRLAGGVAHDFNNMLAVILAVSDIVQSSLPEQDTTTREDIEEIAAAARRGAALTRQLLAFSRRQVINPRVLALDAVVTGVEKMLRRVIGEDVELSVSSASEVGAIEADAGQVEQVVLNLVVNARDAMPSGGELSIDVRDADLEGAAAAHAGVGPGPYVALRVTDTGCGMDAPTMARIFEPFFTTKEVGKGTGLGLSMVFGVVKQTGGGIVVRSEVGRGTTFEVYFPRVSAEPTDDAAGAGAPTSVGGTETVLLVEDDEQLRAVVRKVLAARGYAVLEARTARAALDLAKGARALHLLLTDLVMPEMDGRTLAEQIVAERPGLRVLYMSGYTEHPATRGLEPSARDHFIEKPFTPAEIARAVRRALDARRG